jgi:DNA-binding GntR family transcriptional regulator
LTDQRLSRIVRSSYTICGPLEAGVPVRLQVKSKAQLTYELLRERILSAQLAPGQPLSIDALARELGVSKIPIREAIKQLQAERLVEVVLHVGARVAPISVEEAANLYPIRHALDDLATRLAVPRLTSDHLAQLEALQRQMEAATRQREMRRVEALNREFHQRIADGSGNPQLAQLYRDLMARCSRFRTGVALTYERGLEVMREHRALLAAFARRDLEAASRLSREHDERSARDVLCRLRRAEAEPAAV